MDFLQPDQQTLFPLTDAQILLLWEEAFAFKRDSSPTSNILYYYVTVKSGNVQALVQAYNHVVETNDSLRLRLGRLDKSHLRSSRSDYGFINNWLFRLWLLRIRQYIAPFAYAELPVSQLPDQAAFDTYLKQEFTRRPISLLGGQLLQAELVQIGQDSLVLLMRFHHLLIDGYSFKLLYRQLAEAYDHYTQGQEPPPPTRLFSITRYFNQDVQYRQSPRLDEDKNFWRKSFYRQPHFSFPAGWTPLTSPHANLFGSVTGPLYQACRSLAAESGCSVYGLLMTITALTVYRLTGKDNFAIFTMSHGRHDRTDKQTIGDMINMMPVFYHLPVRLSFSQLIQACNMNYLEAMRHNRLPFNELIKFYPWVSIRHGFNFNHAWCVMSALESENSYCRPPLLPTFLPEQNQAHQFYVDVQETTGLKVDLLVRYQTVKYTRQQVARYLAILIDTLERVIREPDAPAAILRTPGLAESSRRDRTESF